MKGIPTAIAALFVGLLAAYVAYQNYKVGRAKLNLDLFEKRYGIFEKTWAFLSSPPAGLFDSSLDNLIPQASFLFGHEVAEYMRKASRNASELANIDIRAQARGNVIAPEDIPRITELQTWFITEATVGVKEVFGHYLDFSAWR